MPANIQELRRRIKATTSIKQITKAMEMIAASKMRKAQQAALMSRPYADLAWEMVSAVTAAHETWNMENGSDEVTTVHPLLRVVKEPQVVLTIVVAPNRGLCGSLPTQVLGKALADVGGGPSTTLGINQHYITVGRKAERAVLKAGANIIAHFDGFEGQPTVKDTKAISNIVLRQFVGEDVDAVDVVYADFVSTLQYRVQRLRLLPIGDRDTELGTVHTGSAQEQGRRDDEVGPQSARPVGESLDFLFEPSPEAVLNELLPRLVELQVYQVIVEALASEHSSRMVTMQNASKAAGDLIDDFTLTYNSARQAAITAEIAEITGGRLALTR